MYGVEDSVYQKLINYFQKQEQIKQVVLFGSRSKNTATPNSDIDLCITFNGNTKASVKEDIDELIGIYSGDILFSDLLNQEIKEHIERDGVVIYSV